MSQGVKNIDKQFVESIEPALFNIIKGDATDNY